MKRYVIIGGGPAGVNAAIAIRTKDGDGEILLFDRDQDHPYYRTELDTYIGGSTSDADMPLHPETYYCDQRILIRLRTIVTRVQTSERSVELEGGARVPYDVLLLAPGSFPLTVHWPGGQVSGVATLRTWEDARGLIRRITETERPIVLVGGGVLGLIVAEGIRHRGRPVVLLEREPRLWAPVLDEASSELIRQALTQAGIEVFLGEEVVEVHGTNGRVAGVLTSKGKRLDTELVVVAIGVRPDIGFLQGSGIRTDRGILIDHEFRTNIREVFAAGDAAQAYDPVSGLFHVATNWNNAVEQGKLAGAFMAGGGDPYRGVILSNSETFCGLRVSVLGLTQLSSPGTAILSGRDQGKGIYRKLLLRQDKLVGAILVGNTSGEGMMRKMI
ncbi:MAG TPA: FAD-dependent oxidoreductase, partial [Nitrospiraceae bacterium]|nr:FAD-dependent oxidoreductase [Nitrospiraceae bacterium]